jgi:hypothetical protein
MSLLPYSVCAVLLALAALLLVVAKRSLHTHKIRQVAVVTGWLLLPAAWLAYLNEWPLWNPPPKRLPILSMKQLNDFRTEDAIHLARNSTAMIGSEDFYCGVVIASRTGGLRSSLQKRLNPPQANLSLVWILNAKAETVMRDSNSLFVLDAKYQPSSGMWIGWLADPLSSHIRNMDAAVQ